MNSALQEALAAADEAYLVGMSNRGIYKRAVKDLEGAQVSVTFEDDAAQVSVSGEVCTVREPLWESTCSCPSRSVCRHLVSAILWLRDNCPESASEAEILDTPECLPDALEQALREITPAQLKRAILPQKKLLLPAIPQITLTEGSTLTGTIPGGIEVRLLYPLEGSVCTCHKTGLCPHKAAVIAAWQIQRGMLSLDDLTEQIQALKPEDAQAVQASAQRSIALLTEVLQWGLVRMPENLAEHFEAAAVQSHALRMADAERQLRDLGMLLTGCRERRAIFRTEDFLRKITRTYAYLRSLEGDTVTEGQLGQFRRSYESYPGDLNLLPVGQRDVFGGEYEGKNYYFLNLDENAPERFLMYSDLRPVFYEGVSMRGSVPWGAATTMKTLMHSRLTLVNAKISEGKLSSSQETAIASRTKANLNCPEVKRLIHDDFRELAVWLAGQHSRQENRQLCFVHPAKCLHVGFDTHEQALRMTLADAAGDTVNVQVQFRREVKQFIEQLEKIGSTMLETPDTPYVWLCLASFQDGKLTLFPVEVYDFITPEPREAYRLPEQYADCRAPHAPTLLDFFDEVESWLCMLLQSGIRTAPDGKGQPLANRAVQYGMEGFSGMLTELAKQTDAFRHAMNADPMPVLEQIAGVVRYLTLAREKLEVVCALRNMQQY